MSGYIIYWSGTSNVVKIDLAVAFFLVLYLIARRLDPHQEPLNFRAGWFAIPWIIGLTIFSIFAGSYAQGYDKVFGIKVTAHTQGHASCERDHTSHESYAGRNTHLVAR